MKIEYYIINNVFKQYEIKNIILITNLLILALEGASRPSSKLIVNMFSLCTS